MTGDQFVKGQLIAFAYQEAGHCGGIDSMLAVCYVLRNRVKAGWFGGDWMNVLNGVDQSSAYEYSRPEKVDISAEIFQRLLMRIDDIFQGAAEDTMTREGLYYIETHDRGRTMREWFARKIIRDFTNHPRVAQVGMIQIYK